MAASFSRRFSRSLRSPFPFSRHFSANLTPSEEQLDVEIGAEVRKPETGRNFDSTERPLDFQRPLEQGLDPGVYKAILVGTVGQTPVQKRLKSGRLVTLFSVGTGGIRNNRRPLDNEDPREYANKCSIQWHRVSIYPERLGELAQKNVKAGSLLYLEGNLETKVFSDPITGLVRRIREVAIRRDGRLVFLGKDGSEGQSDQSELRSVGYY